MAWESWRTNLLPRLDDGKFWVIPSGLSAVEYTADGSGFTGTLTGSANYYATLTAAKMAELGWTGKRLRLAFRIDLGRQTDYAYYYFDNTGITGEGERYYETIDRTGEQELEFDCPTATSQLQFRLYSASGATSVTMTGLRVYDVNEIRGADPESIVLTRTEIALEPGTRFALTGRVEPADANQGILWQISSGSISFLENDTFLIREDVAEDETVILRAYSMQNPAIFAECAVRIQVPHEDAEDGTPLTMHKRLALPNLPLPDALYYISDGNAVRQYITDSVGRLYPVAMNTIAPEERGYAAQFPANYGCAMDWIQERLPTLRGLIGENSIVCTPVTDIHIRGAYKGSFSSRVLRLKDLKLLGQHIPITYIPMLGDILAATEDRESTRWRFRAMMDELQDANCPVYFTRGNHDYNTDYFGGTVPLTSDIISTNRTWYDYVGKRQSRENVHFHAGWEHHIYFYVDMPELKHRAIFLNSYEFAEDENGDALGHDTAIPGGDPGLAPLGRAEIAGNAQTVNQWTWLLNEALDMRGKTDWVVSFYSHMVPYVDGPSAAGGTSSEFHGYGGDDPVLRRVLHAFMAGEDLRCDEEHPLRLAYQNYNGGITQESYTGRYLENLETGGSDSYPFRTALFAQQGPVRVAGFFAGHIHDDCYKADICAETGTTLHILVSTSTAHADRHWATDQAGTKLPPARNDLELAMSQNVVIINPDTGKVNVVKVGSKRDNSVVTSSDYEWSIPMMERPSAAGVLDLFRLDKDTIA